MRQSSNKDQARDKRGLADSTPWEDVVVGDQETQEEMMTETGEGHQEIHETREAKDPVGQADHTDHTDHHWYRMATPDLEPTSCAN
ncbi:MAG: hypothetical protein Aurels2KO_58090 [Aureliella sp.]